MADGTSRTSRARTDLTTEPRLFVAVPLDAAARLAIETVVEGVRAAEPEGRGVRWVRLDGLHLTLRFLGPTPDERTADVAAAVDAVASTASPFALTISGAGSFPGGRRPRALWLGLSSGVETLDRLASRLDDELAARGWDRSERAFRPHLTLARADGVSAGSATAAALARAVEGRVIEAHVDRLVLFESVTGGGPARYVARSEAPLE
jgi:RNA 2',3'-cyclic 3'-phosphodiesterase